MSLVTIVIPSFNNWTYLSGCLESLMLHQSTPGLFKVVVINNGDAGSIPEIKCPDVKVVDAGSNLGWEGGLKLGLAYCDTEFVVFMNDDTYIPMSSAGWCWMLMNAFSDPKVGAAGPSSNCVMGPQNIFSASVYEFMETKFLIGFCMMVRRKALEEAGGIDDSFPNHGDDIDLSMRLRKAGYKLVVNRYVFVYHHGFKTGAREFGSGWNSVEQTEATNQWLIKKHGLKAFWDTMASPVCEPSVKARPEEEDTEGKTIRAIPLFGKILELGCGPQKTIPGSVGLDIVSPGDEIPGLVNRRSCADIVADLKEPLPVEPETYDVIVARHILEHLVDPLASLRDWSKALKHGGQLVIAVPDQDLRNTIPMNYQHVHCFTRNSMKTLAEASGLKVVDMLDPKNRISFIAVLSKNGLH
jgi:O-antigen biosynthesis protein